MSLYADEIRRVKDLLQQMGRGSKKSLGQNFLVNSQKIAQIIQESQRIPPEQVVEVGPGLGALTVHLREAFAEKLVLLEMDTQFVQYWQEQGAKVVEGDALQLDWKTLNLKKALLVSNLPYQISSRLVVERSVEPAGLERMILMFQKEVAQRITARPQTGDYSLLTVMAQTFWQVKFFAELGPNDFYPPPKVASRVVTFHRKESLPFSDSVAFLKFIKLAFSQKRKFLKKSLFSVIEASKLEEIFAELKIKTTARPEDVSVEQYTQLFLKIQGAKS